MLRRSIKVALFCSVLAFTTSGFAIDMVSTKGHSIQFGPLVKSSNWTFVMLWAHDCLPCERQKPMIEKFHTDTFRRGVSVVGVSTDPASLRHKAEEVYRSTRTSFDNYYFEGNDFSTEYSALTGQRFFGTPTYMLFDPSGKLMGVHMGPVTRTMLDEQFKSKLKEPTLAPSVDLMR